MLFMVSLASHTRRQALCGLAVALLLGSVACKKSVPPPLPPMPTLPAVPRGPVENVEYRSIPGQAIAPVFISDDPAPTPTTPQPTVGGGQGQPATLNGDPNGLTREILNRSIQGAMGSLASCFSPLSQDPMVAVSFEADPTGHPSLLRVNGAPPDAERCIRNIVQGIRFPPFQGKGIQVDLPLSFHRVGRSAQPAGRPAEQQPAGAPLFLQP
jgi:hypothetical protein